MTMTMVGLVSPGAMGAALAKVLTSNGCRVLTDLTGRSEASIRRAQDAGMEDRPLNDIIHILADTNGILLSILPPKDAETFSIQVRDLVRSVQGRIIFVECNAISPETVCRIRDGIASANITFIDGSILGHPPSETKQPRFYISSDPADSDAAQQVLMLKNFGLDVRLLDKGGVGAASALKMSYAGIAKGVNGLFATMILAAHDQSPATAQALVEEMSSTQADLVKRALVYIPDMMPKTYRWVKEMEEISDFVKSTGGQAEQIHQGMAAIFRRLEANENGEKQILLDWTDTANHLMK